MGPNALKYILNVARKSLVKDQGSGIMQVPGRMDAEAKASEFVTRLTNAGIDLGKMDDFIKSEADVKKYLNILDAMEKEKMKVIPADSPRGREITEQLFGKRGEVVDMKGNVIPEGSGIMGGESIESLMKSGDVTKGTVTKKSKKANDRDMFRAANERFKKTDIDKIIKNINKLDPIEAMKEANKIIKRDLYYKGLSDKDAKRILTETEDHIFGRDVDMDPEDFFARGGRVGFKGGADMGTVADSKGNVGAKSVSVSPSGSVTTSNQAPSGPDDRGSDRQNEVQAMVRAGFTPKEINRITNPSPINKIKNSRFNNPITRGILRTGLYTLNPSLGPLDFRKAMQLKGLYDTTMDSINYPDEDDMTLGLITDKQKDIIDRQMKMGDAFDPDATFKSAKIFDDKGETKTLGIFGEDRPAEPMTREEFDAYVREKGYATGGRVGLAGGMTRRAFLKLMGGAAATIGAAKSGIISSGKKGATKKVVKEVIKTPNAPGKPEWFDALVNKVILEGDDVTKKLAIKDRQTVHTKKIDNDSEVTVYRDLDDNSVRVEYNSPDVMLDEPVSLTVKPGQADETIKKAPPAEFETYEQGFVARSNGPDDYSIDPEPMIGNSIKDLETDVTKLKEFATGEKQTLKEFVQSKKRKDKVKKINQGDIGETSDYVTKRQGDYYPEYDDYASGGIAGMLGE